VIENKNVYGADKLDPMTRRRRNVTVSNVIENKRKVCVRIIQANMNIKGGGKEG
jgi:hypothetical protein